MAKQLMASAFLFSLLFGVSSIEQNTRKRLLDACKNATKTTLLCLGNNETCVEETNCEEMVSIRKEGEMLALELFAIKDPLQFTISSLLFTANVKCSMGSLPSLTTNTGDQQFLKPHSTKLPWKEKNGTDIWVFCGWKSPSKIIIGSETVFDASRVALDLKLNEHLFKAQLLPPFSVSEEYTDCGSKGVVCLGIEEGCEKTFNCRSFLKVNSREQNEIRFEVFLWSSTTTFQETIMTLELYVTTGLPGEIFHKYVLNPPHSAIFGYVEANHTAQEFDVWKTMTNNSIKLYNGLFHRTWTHNAKFMAKTSEYICTIDFKRTGFTIVFQLSNGFGIPSDEIFFYPKENKPVTSRCTRLNGTVPATLQTPPINTKYSTVSLLPRPSTNDLHRQTSTVATVSEKDAKTKMNSLFYIAPFILVGIVAAFIMLCMSSQKLAIKQKIEDPKKTSKKVAKALPKKALGNKSADVKSIIQSAKSKAASSGQKQMKRPQRQITSKT